MYSIKKNILKKFSPNSQKNICVGISFLIKLQPEICNFIKKETPIRVFFCEFCEIFKNPFFIEHLQWLLLHVGFFKIKLTYGLHFSLNYFFAGALKIYIANKSLLTQTERSEHILPVLLNKRKCN